MQSADLQVIKDIPGYKVILKAVLKSQIQQLVQQLEEDIGEDFLLLSASVSEGSLSHLGSESGKVFLEDHDDIKAQFLAFCLKRQHTLKQIEKEREQQTASDPERLVPGPKPRYTPTKPHTSPRQLSSLSQSPSRANSVKVTHAPRSNTQRGGASNVRHEPYPGARPRKKAEHSDSVSNLKETIKIEVNDDVDHANRSNNGNEMHSENEKTNSSIDLNSLGPFSDLSSQTDITTEISQSMVGDNSSESSSSTIINKSLHADSKRMDDSVSENIEGASTLASMNIKVETNAEYDSDLEIPGVESGLTDRTYQESGFIQPTGTDSSIDSLESLCYKFACSLCSKRFLSRPALEMHQNVHTGAQPYTCSQCNKKFNHKSNLQRHMKTSHPNYPKTSTAWFYHTVKCPKT